MGGVDAEWPEPLPDDRVPDRPRKGRGAVSNRAGRFEAAEREAVDDGWHQAEGEEDLPPLRTTVAADASRTVISWNRSPDLPFDRSINPYRGCEHGCIYCFARPTHAYLGLSPGLDFETRLVAKFDAPELLAKELGAKDYRCAVMALGTNTDPYQPVERQYRITRRVLEVLAAFNHPVAVVTKSALVTRDLDVLAPMAARGLAAIFVSVTTLDRALARRLEPRAPAPDRRLEAIERIARAGVPVGVMAAPMIPALNDSEMEAILAATRDAGATSAAYIPLRLPLEIKDLFAEWLRVHAPDRAGHVTSLIRQMRGGRLNDSEFGRRMTGSGPYAELLRGRFRIACRRLGLNRRDWRLDVTRFRPPLRAGEQLHLL